LPAWRIGHQSTLFLFPGFSPKLCRTRWPSGSPSWFSRSLS